MDKVLNVNVQCPVCSRLGTVKLSDDGVIVIDHEYYYCTFDKSDIEKLSAIVSQIVRIHESLVSKCCIRRQD